MSHTYTRILIHYVFSTKERVPTLSNDFKPNLFSYMTGIVTKLDAMTLIINGPADHVHMLVSIPPTITIAAFVQKVKANSSGWIHKKTKLKQFEWQIGYGAFSVSESNREAVYQYIADQEIHHQKLTFKEEFIALLKRHGIPYDERYIWD